MSPRNRRPSLLSTITDKALALPPATTEARVTRDLAVPMADGVVLLGDLHQPVGQVAAGPVVLIRLPYGRAGLSGHLHGRTLARRGLQVFIQSTRGTFGSGGHFRPMTAEHDDGLVTLAWVREQPWCDGRVATIGGSYYGHTQWALAPYADPPLECSSLHVTASRFTATFYEGGAPSIRQALGWSANIGLQERRNPLTWLLATPLDNRKIDRALRRLPLQAADAVVTGAPVEFWRDFVAHGEPGDGFWQVANHDEADLTRMPPVTMVSGWWDLFIRDQLHDYAALRAAGIDARIRVGPWIHGEPAEMKAIVQSDIEWLGHHLLGGPAPQGAPVQVTLLGTDTWLEFESWPPPGLEDLTLHLLPRGGLGDAPASGGDARATGEVASALTSSFTYDPVDPTPTAGGPLLSPPGKQADQSAIESRSDVLVFTGQPLPADLDIVGSTRAQVHIRSELPFADVHVRLCDVDEKGVSRNIVDGIRRVDPRTMEAPDLMPADDGSVRIDLELFPTAYRVRQGHRLRVQIAGGAFPRFARNHGTGEPFGTATALRRNRIEILHDESHPSGVVIPTRQGAAPDGG